MKAEYDHKLLSSFKEWFSYKLLKDADAYVNVTSGELYPLEGKSLVGYQNYSAPNHQWVYDQSITGANVPTGVYADGVLQGRGTNGLRVDFNHGRAIFDEDSYTNETITANYSYKEFNLYLTTQPDYKLMMETKFEQRPIQISPTGLPADTVVAPCVFIKQFDSMNEPYSMGGEDLTLNRVKAIVFSDSSYKDTAIGSLFRDTNNVVFPLLKMSDTPIGEFGDIKSGSYWNYEDLMASRGNQGNIVHIDDVTVSRVENDFISDRHPKMHVSVIDFVLKKSRYPRQ